MISPCQLGYQTFGRPNADFSNIIILPSWFRGTADAAPWLLGPNRMFDPTGYYVIAIDAFANGAASSPSNSPSQKGLSFPNFGLEDVVEAQYRLLTEVLGISHVKAVLGISMGGMQALQWGVAHSDYMDSIISVVGTPRVTAQDAAPWNGAIAAMEAQQHQTGTRPRGNPKMTDFLYQLRAMRNYDMAPGAPLSVVASLYHARTLMVLNAWDTLLNPQPSVELAGVIGAQVVQLHGVCGHFAPAMCETTATRIALTKFLRE